MPEISETDRAAEAGRRAAELYARINSVKTKNMSDEAAAISEHFMRMNDPEYAKAYRQLRKPALDSVRGLPASTSAAQGKAVRDKHFEVLDRSTKTRLEAQRAGSRIYQTPDKQQQTNMFTGLGYGAAAGGGLGLLIEAIREKTPEEKKQPFLRKALRYAAMGGAGALAGGALGRRIGGSMPTKTATAEKDLAALKPNNQYQTGERGMSAAYAFGEKIAVNFKALSGLLQTPGQAGQKAMLAAQSQVRGPQWAQSPGLPKGVGGFVQDAAPMVPNPHHGSSVFGDASKYIPLSELGNQAANRQKLKHIGAAGVAATGALARQIYSQPQKERQPMRQPVMIKTQSAHEFGEKIALNIPGLNLNLDMSNPAIAAGVPMAGLGALAGGLYGGLSDPGEEEYVDENGRVRRQPRSRLLNALRGALGGATTLGLGGAAAGYFAPNQTQQFGAYLRSLMPGANAQNPAESAGPQATNFNAMKKDLIGNDQYGLEDAAKTRANIGKLKIPKAAPSVTESDSAVGRRVARTGMMG